MEKADTLLLAPQVLVEFIHVVTDSKRFSTPLSMQDARSLAHQWWTAREVKQVFPDQGALDQFFHWHNQFQLGRKRLLDTLLAATYWRAGASSILTTNPTDFASFGVFTCIFPGSQAASS
jgi:predicted nucleic acid-binding protein